MAAGGEGGVAQDEVSGVLRCSETQLAGGVAGAVPFILRRNFEVSASRPSQPTSILMMFQVEYLVRILLQVDNYVNFSGNGGACASSRYQAAFSSHAAWV